MMTADTESRTNRGWRRLRWFAGSTLFVLVLLAGLVGTAFMREEGRVWLLTTALTIADHQLADVAIEVDGVRAPNLGHWSVRRLDIHRQGKPLVTLTELQLLFDWRRLRYKDVIVHRLSANVVSVYIESEADDKAGDAVISIPDVDFRPWLVEIKSITANRLQLLDSNGAPLIPDNNVQGRLALWRDNLPVQASIAAKSLSTPGFTNSGPSELMLDTELQPDQSLAIDLSWREPAQGMLASWLQLPTTEKVNIEGHAVLRQNEKGYQLNIDTLRFPWLQHQMAISGEVAVDAAFTAVVIPELRWRIDEHEHVLHGQWRDQQLHVDGIFQQLPLAILSPWWPVVVDGEFSGTAAVKGPLDDLLVTTKSNFTAHFNDEGKEWIFRGNVDGSYTADRINLNAATLDVTTTGELPQARAAVTGVGEVDWGKNTIDLKGAIAQLDTQWLQNLFGYFDLAWPEPLETLKARAVMPAYAVSGLIDGQIDKLQIQLRGEVAGQYQTQAFNLRIDGQGRWPKANFRKLVLTSGDAVLSASGTFDAEGAGNAFQASLRQFDLAMLQQWQLPLPDDLSGQLSGDVDVQGVLRKPVTSFRAQGLLHSNILAADFDAILRGRSEQHRLIVESLHVKPVQPAVEQTQLQLSGEADLRSAIPGMQWQVRAEQLPMAWFSALGWPDPDGTVAIDIALNSPPAKKIDTPWLESTQWRGTFDYVSGLAVSDADPKKPARPVHWSGKLDEADTQHWRLTSSIALADPESLSTAGNPDDTAAKPEKNAAQKNATDDNVAVTKSTADKGLPSNGSTTVGELTVSLNKASLAAMLADENTLPKLQLLGEMDLRAINFLLPGGIDVGGQLQADLRLSGERARPLLDGTVTLDQGAVTSAELGLALSPIQLRAEATGQSLQIRDLIASDTAGGKLKAHGNINWSVPDAKSAVLIDVNAQQLKLIQRRDVDAVVNGDLQLSGSFQELLLAGDVEVEPFAASIEGGAPGADIPEINVKYARESEQESASWLPLIKLNILLHANQQAYLRGRGLNAELAGNLRLKGTLDKLAAEGQFNTVRGYFELVGNRFDLTNGSVTFNNDALAILVTGELNKSGTKIIAQLSGTNEKLELKLSSEPDMPEDEILAWMMFGKSIRDMSAAQAIQLAAALNGLTGGGGFDPIDSTRQLLGVDKLIIDTAETDDGTGTGVSVGAGKYLSEKVYLELERTAEPTEPWRSNIIIELTPSISLHSTVGTGTASQGVELQWHRDY